jgi:ComF family protein
MTLCHVCHAWQAHVVCEDCIQTFAQPVERCRRCALPTALCAAEQSQGHTHPLCTLPGLAIDQCIAAVDYAYPWSQCIARLKFGDDVGLAATLAHMMRHSPWAEPALEQADRVMPLPLSAQRLQERGFNQTLELSRHLGAKRIDTHSLVRLETETHQVGANREERWTQAQHGFYIAPEALPDLRGQRVVLVDDVMTTGATLQAAAATLRRAGVAHITALVLARTLPPHRAIADNHGHVPHRACTS